MLFFNKVICFFEI